MTFDRSSLPEITPEVRRTWRRTRQDHSAGGVAYRYVLPSSGARQTVSLAESMASPSTLPSVAIKATTLTPADGSSPQSMQNDRSLQIALIATHGNQRWQLPKGSREVGETSLETAIREVEEETGLTTENMQFLQTIDYWYWDTYQKDVPELVHKLVDFYLLRVIGGELNDSSYEVDDVQWFTPADALREMTFGGEKIVVKQALDLLQRLYSA